MDFGDSTKKMDMALIVGQTVACTMDGGQKAERTRSELIELQMEMCTMDSGATTINMVGAL
jgi:hypothetical protein